MNFADSSEIILPVINQTCDIERLKRGGEHWQWNNDLPTYIGVLPRYGASSDDVKVSNYLNY